MDRWLCTSHDIASYTINLNPGSNKQRNIDWWWPWSLVVWYLAKDHASLLMQRSGIHSFRSHIRDHFVLEWKSTLKIVESTPKYWFESLFWELIPLFERGFPLQTKWSLYNMTPKRVDFHSYTLRECKHSSLYLFCIWWSVHRSCREVARIMSHTIMQRLSESSSL